MEVQHLSVFLKIQDIVCIVWFTINILSLELCLMLINNADNPLSMLLGSKNPQISLKLAEIRTDQHGKVGACAQTYFFSFFMPG